MEVGAITGYVDVAQVTLYAFWIFFAGLIFYLRREDKREGYPLESERSAFVTVQGFPPIPEPKTFRLRDGRMVQAPNRKGDTRPVAATPAFGHLGAPLVPTGDPLADAVGPASYAERAEEPERTWEGEPLIAPARLVHGVTVAKEDADPRGMVVVAADKAVAGTVVELWVDRSEPQIRYLEVETGEGGRRVLMPINFAWIDPRRREVRTRALTAAQIARVPGIASESQITKREEDRICAYWAGGFLYATPDRQEPLL